jgi:hypothetical protein
MSIDEESNARRNYREQRARAQDAKNTYYSGTNDKKLPPYLPDPGTLDAEINYLDGKLDKSLGKTRASEMAADNEKRQKRILGEIE